MTRRRAVLATAAIVALVAIPTTAIARDPGSEHVTPQAPAATLTQTEEYSDVGDTWGPLVEGEVTPIAPEDRAADPEMGAEVSTLSQSYSAP